MRIVFEEALSIFGKTEATVQLVIGLGFLTDALVAVEHLAFWTALLNEVRLGPTFSMMYSDGYMERNLSERGDVQHMHVRRKPGMSCIEVPQIGESGTMQPYSARTSFGNAGTRDGRFEAVVGQTMAEFKVNDLEV